MNKIQLVLSFLFLLSVVVGCQSKVLLEPKEPFIFTYNYNTVNSEEENEVQEWLVNAKADIDSGVHMFSTEDGYEYFFAKGYNDVEILYERKQYKEEVSSIMTANFQKGNEADELLIEVQYDPSLCCDMIVVDDSYKVNK